MPAMAKTTPKLTDYQTYMIAHSAQCKLNMSAKDPDRNLRFMLGHAFLLDKVLYRVAEIEDERYEDTSAAKVALGEKNGAVPNEASAPAGQSGSLTSGRVRFAGSTEAVNDTAEKAEDDEDDAVISDDDEDAGLGLTRFASASEMPPRMIPDEGDDVDEDDGPVSPPSLPADFDVAALVQQDSDEELGNLYTSLKSCPCRSHNLQAEKSKGFWEVKDSSKPGKRLAVMQVEV